MRTKGALSTVLIPLKNLKNLFQDDALIPVAIKFARQNNLTSQPQVVVEKAKEADEPIQIQEVV